MRYCFMLAVAAGALASISSAGSATTFVKYTDRASFNGVAGATRTETFNSFTSDIDLASGHDFGDFTMKNERVGPYGSSIIDAAPFYTSGASLNGTPYVRSAVNSFSSGYVSSLFITFDEAITAFGANFTSGSVGQIEMLVDGELLQGAVTTTGGFFGFLSDKSFKQIELRARQGSGYFYTFDDMTYSTAAVPEPATWGMMIGGLALVGGTMRRRRTQIAFS